jgi:spore coat polysaccharide biosynthesis predicted glycosyltransferase SpsG
MSLVRWGFRISSRLEAGAGHVTRCLALIDEIRASSSDDVVMFLDSSGPDAALAQRLPMGGRRESDGASCSLLLAAARSNAVQAVLFDSYAVPDTTIQSAAQIAFTVMLEDRGVARGGHFGLRPGFGMALLDRVFAEEPLPRTRTSTNGPRLLVSFGARDSKNLTGAVLEALAPVLEKFELITVILGGHAPHRAALEARHAGSVEFVSPPTAAETRSLLTNHHLAVGAAGVGLLERMASGLPGIVISIAENQHGNAAAAADAGAAVFAGSIGSLHAPRLCSIVQELLDDPARLERMAACGRTLVDGRGAGRAVQAIRNAYYDWRRTHVSL